jgi:hypothetical protein
MCPFSKRSNEAELVRAKLSKRPRELREMAKGEGQGRREGGGRDGSGEGRRGEPIGAGDRTGIGV